MTLGMNSWSRNAAATLAREARPQVSYVYFGSGLYAFSFPKNKQAQSIEEGLRLFRARHPKLPIGSTILSEGYTSDMMTMFIVCNPPYESSNVG